MHVLGERLVDQASAGVGQRDDPAAAIGGARSAVDQPGTLQPVDPFGHTPSGDHGESSQLSWSAFEWFTGAPQRREHIELSFAQAVAAVHQAQLCGEMSGYPMQPADDPLRAHIEVWAFATPLLLDPCHVVVGIHTGILASQEGIVASVEANLRWIPVTAIAPIAWGTTYYVTSQFLPASPLYGSVFRALPAGLLLMLVCRQLPRGSWWWKSAVLGLLNVGAFFVLVYLAALLLPSSVASTIMATSPAVMMLIAWGLVAERPRILALVGAAIGLGGVALMLLTGVVAFNTWGVLASLTAMTMSSVGYILAKKWTRDVDLLAATAWQLVVGGAVLIPFAIAVEGSPPAMTWSTVGWFGYISVIATAVAYVAWFSGLRHLSAGSVGLIGLLNPVTGVLLGVLLAAEVLSPQQTTGLLLVLIGIVLGQQLRRRARPTVEPVAPRTASRA